MTAANISFLLTWGVILAFSIQIAQSLSYSNLPRIELQAIAKQNGIKANIASAEIIKQLDGLKGVSPVVSQPKTALSKTKPASNVKPAPKDKPVSIAKSVLKVMRVPKTDPAPKAVPEKAASKAELSVKSPEISKLLDEQGLQVKDLLELRKSLEASLQAIESRPSPTVRKGVAEGVEADRVKAKAAANSAKSKAIKATKYTLGSAPATSSILSLIDAASKSSLPEDPAPAPKPAQAVAAVTKPAAAARAPISVPAPAPVLSSKAFAPVPPPPTPPAKPSFSGWTPHFATTSSTVPSKAGKPSTTTSTRTSTSTQPSMDGVTLESMLTTLVAKIGFEGLFEQTKIKAFYAKPTVASSLKALRVEGMDWARVKVTNVYKKTMSGR